MENDNPLVSIIVPMYEAERYIERCARSLFEQTFYELEYIFVDDFCSDNTIKILKKVKDEYPERKNQIKILHHKTNKGVSAARNSGLDSSTGEYILQVDSDDWIDSSAIELMYEYAKDKNVDLVWTDFIVEYPNDSEKTLYRKENVPEEPSICILGILKTKFTCRFME